MRFAFIKYGFLAALMMALVVGFTTPLIAQDSLVTVSLAVPEFQREAFDADLIAQFEAQNPGIKVEVKSSGDMGFVGSPAYGMDQYLEDMQEYVSSADVVFINSNSLTIEGTRAGFLLDLSPLTSADASLNVDDFIPEAWESFQWDRGVWALPAAVDVILLVYNPTAFDEAGLAYPNGAWTMDDFANAARALTQRDENGEITSPGYVDFGNTKYLLRSLLGASLVDNTVLPSQVTLDNPALESLLTTWKELQDEGVVGGVGGGNQIVLVGGGASGPAMTIQQSFGLATFPGTQGDPTGGSLLPGGRAGMEVQGFGISAGTQYPDQAYALAKFLTSSIDVADNLFGSAPARRSLAGMESESGNGGPLASLTFTPENQTIIDEAFANALPVQEVQFTEYVSVALDKMINDNLDASSALQEAEAEAVANLNAAAEFQQTNIVSVATPVPATILNPGEVSLNFGMVSFIVPMPNQAQWDQVISDFVASDAQVGQIAFNTARETDLESLSGQFDCYYIPTNGVPDGDLSNVLNLDPYMDADPTFDKSDVMGNSLAQVQFDNKTWAFPIVIQPEVLRYNSELFASAGVAIPENGWTIDEFVDALKALKDYAPDSTPFVPRDFGGSYLRALIAAYGGLPMDSSTTPTTLNFTDPATVDAIRQVLDLAKAGYIKYDALASSVGGRVFALAMAGGEDEDAIYTHSMSALNFFAQQSPENAESAYRLTTFPQGSQYTPLAYNIGTAYISVNAENPEACYNWLSTLSRHPELFSAMPARRSLINDPAVTASQSADTVALYNEVDALMAQPNVISLPTAAGPGGSPADFWIQNWLNRAFDRYVLEDANLEDELAQAEMYAKDYQQCAANIPPLDAAAGDTPFGYFQQFVECASSVDPTMSL